MLGLVGHNKQTSGVSVLHMHINAAIHARVRETAKREGRTIRNLVEHALLEFLEFIGDAEASEDRAKLIRIMRHGGGR